MLSSVFGTQTIYDNGRLFITLAGLNNNTTCFLLLLHVMVPGVESKQAGSYRYRGSMHTSRSRTITALVIRNKVIINIITGLHI